MTSFSISQIAASLGAPAFGDTSLRVRGAAEPEAAGPDDLALAMQPGFAEGLSRGHARAAVLWPGADWQAFGLAAAIEAPRARLALARLTGLLASDLVFRPGISPKADIAPDAEVARDAWIGPFTEIGPGAVVGPGARIAGRVSIGANVVLGRDARIHPGVVLQPGVRLGDRVEVQPGAVIGADGFSYVTESVSHPETVKATAGAQTLTPPDADARWHKIASLGGVEICDDVEVGANATIDAGTIRPTRIGARSKLDNLVHVGHNCRIGEDNLICGQAGIAGSVVTGDRVVLAGQVGIADHLVIGSDVVIGAGSGVLSNVASGRVMLGYPAARMQTTLGGYKALRRLARKAVSKPRPQE